MQKSLAIQLIVLFLITQLIGLGTASTLIKEEVHATIVTDDPEDVENAIGLFVYILVFTGVFLFAITFFKRRRGLFIKILETVAVFGASLIVFTAFLGTLGFMFAVLLLLMRKVLQESIWVKNIATVMAVSGVGALLGVSLGVFPVLVFIVLLAVYDLVAVFGTKHMVKMAKAISKENLAFTYALPTKKHLFQLGSGDMVIPLTFAVTVMNATAKKGFLFPEYFIPAGAILVASLVGLILTLEIAEKKRIALPALPLQTLLMVIVWFAAVQLGF